MQFYNVIHFLIQNKQIMINQNQEDKIQCIGCRREFQEGQTLPNEGIFIQYKNYYLPIQQHQQKWILLKTIVAFLNSKGGTIYMGVDDSTREVIGVKAQLKQQDQFMLQLDRLMEQIKPQIDLRHREQVRVQYVPVLVDKSFQGKYIIKIIVKQGDPAKVYHFVQTIKFISEDRKHHDEQFQVLWGFYRSNMGKVDSIKGTQLVRQVYQKAKRPSTIIETFHPGCHPEPLRPSIRNMNIGFKNVGEEKFKQKLKIFIKDLLKKLNLENSYVMEENQEQSETLILKFKSITQFKQADSYVVEHLQQLSDLIEGDEILVDEGVIDNIHFYKVGKQFNPANRYRRNRSKSRKTQQGQNLHQTTNNSNPVKQQQKKLNFKQQGDNLLTTTIISPSKNIESRKIQKISIQIPNLDVKQVPISKIQEKKNISKSQEQPPGTIKPIYELSFTNINQKSFEKIDHYLNHSMGKSVSKIPKKIELIKADKSVYITFYTSEDIDKFVVQLQTNPHHSRVLNGFSNNKKIVIVQKKGSQQSYLNLKQMPLKSESSQQQQNKTEQSKQPKQKIIGFPLIIKGFHNDLSNQSKIDIIQIINQLLKKTLGQNKSLWQITNQKQFFTSIQILFQEEQSRKNFSKALKIQSLDQKSQLLKFCVDNVMSWGSPTGNIIVHEYPKQEKKHFKEQIQKVFQGKQLPLKRSRFVKGEQFFYLNLSFHPGIISKCVDKIEFNLKNDPVFHYQDAKTILVDPELSKV